MSILGIGNPLLDISASVPQEFLEKYKIKGGNAILAEKDHLPIFQDLIDNHKVDYIAGGASQNSIRAAAWMLQKQDCTFIGCVGKDQFAEELEKSCKKDLVTPLYQKVDTPTGTCAVCIVKQERSLVANISAAEKFELSFLDSEPVKKAINDAKIIYCTGFFLTHNPAALVQLGKHCNENNKKFIMNLSAPFLIDFFFDQMKTVLPFVDIAICNEDEAATLGKKMGWGSDLSEIATKLASFERTSGDRMVIFTQGSKQTVTYESGKVTHHDIIPIEKEKIVDTNGAGDSFVGGFLAGLALGRDTAGAIKLGHYCARECIQHSGCAFTGTPQFE